MQKESKQSENKKLSLAVLKKWRANEAKKLTENSVQPHGMIVASLLHRLFVERMAFALVLSVFTIFTGWQMLQNSRIREKLDKKSIFLIPSTVSDLTELDPTKLDNSTVYNYAEQIVHKLGNVSFEDADVRYKELTTHMHPELKARFTREMRPIIKYWKQMKVDQHFNFESPTKFTRKLEMHEGSKKSVFRVDVWGRTKKYIDGRATEPYRERISLAFVTKMFSADDRWAFRLIDLSRKTQQQIDDERIKLAERGEDKS